MMNYSLVVRNVKSIEEYQHLHRILEAMDLINYVFEKGEYYPSKEAVFNSCEEQNWNSFLGDMINISELFSEMVFELTIQAGKTFSRMYFKDGVSETCYGEVIYEAPKKIEWNSLVVF